MSRVFVDRVVLRVRCVFNRRVLLIVPTICHVLINGLDAHPKRIWSSDFVDDQFLDRSCVIFTGSRGRRFPGSCDESRVGSCDMFPRSRGAEVTGL